MDRVFGDKRAIAILLGPALFMYTAIMLVPSVWSLFYAFSTGNVIEGFRPVGLDNFRKLLDDPIVPTSLRFTVTYALVITVGQILLGLALALFYVFVLRRASALIRTLVFFPVVLPTVAVGLLFSKMFAIAPQTGPANSLLDVLGFGATDWFSTGSKAFWVIILMDLWRTMGFYAVLLYTGLLDIPGEVLESARLDGAVGWRLLRHIVLPLALPVLISSIIFSLNSSLKVFDSVVALTNGGPGTSTTPLNLYMFQTSFFYSDYGYGSTLAILITTICLTVTLFLFRSSRRDLTKG
ncbi:MULTISPECIES: carbohydrate ABC transporter permease [Micromonospora]|uniref:ABC transporter permease n=1 Tax=Micromonospora haikouensis TaxID=686309 RepID=A0A0D0WQZ7_9ACTN|nr:MULTISPECIES: sugar ABC transporter permease [Micromonospora]KIR61426.1 ABC transporter permease [Micromonospora haikouensis]